VMVRATQEVYRKAALDYWEGEDESAGMDAQTRCSGRSPSGSE
jgi:hypothetical protein